MILCVQKAMRILSVISNGKNLPVPLGEIARATGYPKPTCAHLLETLCAEGVAERVSQAEGYRLGLSVYHWVRYGRYEEELITLCRPVLKWIARNTHATPLLSVIRNHRKFIIDVLDDEQHIFLEQMQVRQDDIYRTATGRAILAHMDQDKVWEIYQKYGQPMLGEWKSVTSYETLLEELKQLRRERIIVAEDTRPGKERVIGYACPLFRRGECIGAVGLGWRVSPDEPFEEHSAFLQKTLLKATQEIHRRFSYEEE